MAPPTNHVLVTGGTGFVATHILDQLVTVRDLKIPSESMYSFIQGGHKITATTRDATKAQKLYETFPKYKNTVTFVSVPDFTVPGAFDKVFESSHFDYVLHTASPIPFAASDLQKDIIDPGPLGTNSLLQAAHKFGGKDLKRVVLTSSGVTLIDPFLPKGEGLDRRYDEEDWNTVSITIPRYT